VRGQIGDVGTAGRFAEFAWVHKPTPGLEPGTC